MLLAKNLVEPTNLDTRADSAKVEEILVFLIKRELTMTSDFSSFLEEKLCNNSTSGEFISFEFYQFRVTTQARSRGEAGEGGSSPPRNFQI